MHSSFFCYCFILSFVPGCNIHRIYLILHTCNISWLSYFPWLCAWFQESWVFCPLSLCYLMMCLNKKYVMTWWSYSFFYTPHWLIIIIFTDVSESIELLKFVSGRFCLECVSKIKSTLSIIFHAIYGAVRIQLTHFSYDDCENMFILSYYRHQIGRMTHLPMFRARSWNNDMCCMSFYILITTKILHKSKTPIRNILVTLSSVYMYDKATYWSAQVASNLTSVSLDHFLPAPKWHENQVTQRNPKWLHSLTWDMSWVALTSSYGNMLFGQ